MKSKARPVHLSSTMNIQISKFKTRTAPQTVDTTINFVINIENTAMIHNINEKYKNDKYGSEGYTMQSLKFIINKLYVLAISLFHCSWTGSI